MNLRSYIIILIAFLGETVSKAQVIEPIKLHLDTVICNNKLSIKDIVDSPSIDSSIILANQIGNSINFFIAKRTGSCWRVFTYENQNKISHEDSVVFFQINEKGSMELVIFNSHSFGNSGVQGGNSTTWTDLIIIDLDQEIVLFDKTISIGEEIWSNEINKNATSEEDDIISDAKVFQCNSYPVINNGQLQFKQTCHINSSKDEISKEEKTEFCERCISGIFKLKNNKFVR